MEGFEPAEPADYVEVGFVSYGKGTFARRDIPQGTCLGPVTGRIFDDPGYTSEYCIDLGGPYSLEPAEPFRCLNHHCDPNCALYIVDWEDESRPGTVYVEVLRDISKGQELTIDYQWSADGAIPCLCGSSNCRGWVVDLDQLEELQQRLSRKQKKKGRSLYRGR